MLAVCFARVTRLKLDPSCQATQQTSLVSVSMLLNSIMFTFIEQVSNIFQGGLNKEDKSWISFVLVLQQFNGKKAECEV